MPACVGMIYPAGDILSVEAALVPGLHNRFRPERRGLCKTLTRRMSAKNAARAKSGGRGARKRHRLVPFPLSASTGAPLLRRVAPSASLVGFSVLGTVLRVHDKGRAPFIRGFRRLLPPVQPSSSSLRSGRGSPRPPVPRLQARQQAPPLPRGSVLQNAPRSEE